MPPAPGRQSVPQGERGEQGDPLMPALYSLAQHGALEAFARQMQPGEAVLAFLDDTFVVSNPQRARPTRDALQLPCGTMPGRA